MKALQTLSLVFGTALLAVQLYAQTGGIVFVEEQTQQGRTTTNRILLDADRMRAESLSAEGRMAFVFDGSAGVIRMINIERRTYIELSRREMEEMQQQMAAALAQMEEQLRNLPPAQRQMMERMMRGQAGATLGMPAQPRRLEYRAAGLDRVGQWECTRYDAFTETAKSMEICAADVRDLGLTPADFQVARQLMEFLKTMMPQIANQVVIYGQVEDQGFEGVPVRRTIYENGAVVSFSELKEMRREAIPESAFQVPEGFTRQALPGR